MKSKMITPTRDLMLRLREALEASWDRQTAYQAVEQKGNPALGQCYPTSWVVQHYFPATEIIKGTVKTSDDEEIHFWNGLLVAETWYHIDLSWHQFTRGAVIKEFVVLDRTNLGDSAATVQRCHLLLHRVESYLSRQSRLTA